MSETKVTPKEYLKNGDNYFPNTVANSTKELPPGAYQLNFSMDAGIYLSPINIMTDKIVAIPNSVTEQVVAELKRFWSEGVSQKFQDYGLVHKRGVILEGPPGTGKTVTLAESAKVVIEQFAGVVLFNPNPELLPPFLKVMKEIEPSKKVCVIWEEFDSTLRRYESELLSILDGEIQVGNIFYLATTNYISKIPARIKNRPSRFARVIHVDKPTVEARRAFLRAKLTAEDQSQYLEAMVEASDGFVMDQVKDLIISVCCFNYPISDAVLKIKEMSDNGTGVDDYEEEMVKSHFQAQNNGPRTPLKPLR